MTQPTATLNQLSQQDRTATNARSATFSPDASSVAETGPACTSKASSSSAASLQPTRSGLMSRLSGLRATVAASVIGDDSGRCAGCQVGQGRQCACRDAIPPRNLRAMRWVLIGLAGFWAGAAVVAWRAWA